MMKRHFAIGLVTACGLSSVAVHGWPASVAAQDSGHAECSHLVMLKFPDVKVSGAVSVPAATTGAIRAAHCRVRGVIGTEINFELLLPDRWNHKFFMGGGGGYVGTVQNQAQATVNLGYATVGTDTGHQGGMTDASWALDNIERRTNFGFLAVHRTSEVAKSIVRAYYGGEIARNYFSGCSRGGGQALMEAQRYPDDFDGIVAAAPAFDWTAIAAQFVKDAQAAFPDPHALATPMFPPETLKSIEAQILDKCDALDGVKDGLMEDPRRCKVDVATLTGLTDAQKTALRKIYAETTNREGLISPGQPFGGEGQPQGWQTWITGANSQLSEQGPSLRFAFGTQFFKYLVFNDPSWDYSRYDLSSWRKDTKFAASYMNATSPDLEAFKARGHKLVLWHGWSDPALTALASIRYYEQVQARDPKVHDFFRLFMAPGVLHCGGGPGPDTADWSGTIADWIENGKAPDRVVARKLVNGAVVLSRPLCAYPQHAQYKGSGSTDEADNFTCVQPRPPATAGASAGNASTDGGRTRSAIR
jgi:feruloyl esterase